MLMSLMVAIPLALSPLRPPAPDTAVFAGGCFWGIEGVFDHVKGVQSATSGYAGGTLPHPSYEVVSTGKTGYAESVRVIFDPAQITYAQLLQIFFSVHDPTQLNRQGPDVGNEYRSIVFFRDNEQKRAAESYLEQLRSARTFAHPIVTEIAALGPFYAAEAYHQHFLEQHPDLPYIVINDLPKIERLRRGFPSLYHD